MVTVLFYHYFSQRSDAEESPASVYETDEEESDTVSIFWALSFSLSVGYFHFSHFMLSLSLPSLSPFFFNFSGARLVFWRSPTTARYLC